jgi:hypothetical protein
MDTAVEADTSEIFLAEVSTLKPNKSPFLIS